MRLVDAVHVHTSLFSLWSLCFCFPEYYDGAYSTEFMCLICVCILIYCKLFCVFLCPPHHVRGDVEQINLVIKEREEQ
jgi:hypothetical protein